MAFRFFFSAFRNGRRARERGEGESICRACAIQPPQQPVLGVALQTLSDMSKYDTERAYPYLYKFGFGSDGRILLEVLVSMQHEKIDVHDAVLGDDADGRGDRMRRRVAALRP